MSLLEFMIEQMKKLAGNGCPEPPVPFVPPPSPAFDDAAGQILADLKSGGMKIVPLGKVVISGSNWQQATIKIGDGPALPLKDGPVFACQCKLCQMRAKAPWN